jgi:chromosomal replication initiation ATPase DnaA
MSELQTFEHAIIRPARVTVVTSLDRITERRCQAAARAYRQSCEMHPEQNRVRLAFFAGAVAFEAKPADLRSPRRDLAEIRQQLMAFSQVISQGPWSAIGRMFCRHHSTVIHAAKKYGPAIAHVIMDGHS